jgi:hypothetical protein
MNKDNAISDVDRDAVKAITANNFKIAADGPKEITVHSFVQRPVHYKGSLFGPATSSVKIGEGPRGGILAEAGPATAVIAAATKLHNGITYNLDPAGIPVFSGAAEMATARRDALHGWKEGLENFEADKRIQKILEKEEAAKIKVAQAHK